MIPPRDKKPLRQLKPAKGRSFLLTEEEKALWLAQMAEVSPLESKREMVPPKRVGQRLTPREVPGAEIDLHGMSQDEAYAALMGWLPEVIGYYPEVRVITGRGKGVLRREVPRWLAASAPWVVGVEPVSDGVLDVTLRRAKPLGGGR